MRYNVSMTRLAEKMRQLYLKPLVARDDRNHFEKLDIEAVHARLKELNIAVEPYPVDWPAFQRFRDRHAGRFGRWSRSIEKQLEYFISQQLLLPEASDCLIDVGSWFSTYPDLIREDFGAQVYAQDLAYPEGIHDGKIGGDAAKMPLPDASVSRMALHCTFEHFERDADTRFIHEARRVLSPGGRVVIVPLYIHQHYTVWTDPSLFASARIVVDPGARLFRKVGWSNQFGRHYSPEALRDRLLNAAGDLNFRILRVDNVADLDPRCYVRFIGLIEKPSA
jgi:hypothetical protein